MINTGLIFMAALFSLFCDAQRDSTFATKAPRHKVTTGMFNNNLSFW